MSTFTIEEDRFSLNGKPFRILSGAMHYFRVIPEYWEDRLRKMRLMGLNTVETYVAWNLHEPRPGEFCFDGGLDLARYVRLAVDVLLFTSDGPTDAMLQYGTLPDIFKTVNFSDQPESSFARLREYQSGGPPVCMEFWNGWFDHWGEEHHTRPSEDAAAVLDRMLAAGASANLYMFHGGTNFGFMNGANCQGGSYQPTITSYDYDAPLTEAGDITPKYLALREVIGRYESVPDVPLPEPSPKMALDPVGLTESVGLFKSLTTVSSPIPRPAPEPMEYLDQSFGFILYRTEVTGPREEAVLTIRDLHDRAQVFLNGHLIGVLAREVPEKTLSLAVPANGARLDILVENMGRVNYGPDLLDRKGITEGVLLGQQYLFDWHIFPLPLDDLERLNFSPSNSTDGPVFYRGTFTVTDTHDTFLALPGWTKGVCWVNGSNLGRYWNRGPQRTLYLPAPLLREGANELIVFELHGTERRTVEFRDRPELG